MVWSLFIVRRLMAGLLVAVNLVSNEWIQRYFGFLYAWLLIRLEGRGMLAIL